jgi:hypothetical protein
MKMNPCSLLLAAAVMVLNTGTLHATKKTPNVPAAPNVVDVNAGQLDIMLDTTFTSVLASQGVLATFHGTADSTPPNAPKNTRGFRIYGGEVDTNSGEGEFETVGDLQFNNGNIVVELRHLTLDTTGAVPVITAEVLVNNAITGRFPVFTLVVDDLFATPPTGTSIATPTVAMAVSDTFVTLFNSIFTNKPLFLGVGAGSASVMATTGSIP